MRTTIFAAMLLAASAGPVSAYCASWDTACLATQQPGSDYGDAYQPLYGVPIGDPQPPVDLLGGRYQDQQQQWQQKQWDNPPAEPLGLHSDTQDCRVMLCTE